MRAIASLSDVAWVTDSQTLLTKLIEYYLFTDASQSTVFVNNIRSLPKTYYLNINDPTNMASSIKRELNLLCASYFDSVDVDAYAEPIDKTSTWAVSLFIEAVGEDGVRVNAGKALKINSNGIQDSINIANGGEAVAYVKNQLGYSRGV